MIDHGMRLSECLCCFKKCVAFVDNQRIIISLCTKLFSLKINVTEETMPCICFKCYLRLKLCYAYRTPFANLYKHIRKPIPSHTIDLKPRFNDVSIVSHCPVCFALQPSSKHIYEHLLNREYCNVCCINVNNLLAHYEASPKCNLNGKDFRDTALVYYCSGSCGASFKRRKLFYLHQKECEHAQKQVKAENTESMYPASSSSASNSPIHMDVSVGIEDDEDSADENDFPNDQNSTSEQHTILSENNEPTETVINSKSAVSKPQPRKRCCPICGKWVIKIHPHLRTHDPTRKPTIKAPRQSPRKSKRKSFRKTPLKDLPMVPCRFCRKMLTEVRVKKHETLVCPLRNNTLEITGSSNDQFLPETTVNGNNTTNNIPVKPSSSKLNSRQQCCNICGKWVNHLKEHLLVHDPNRVKGPWPKNNSKPPRHYPPKIECKYCHKLFMIGSRIEKHETEVCPLRHNDQTLEVKTEPSTGLIVDENVAYPDIKPTVHNLNFYKQCCPICGKWVNKLSLHLFTHSSTPQFQCKHCHKFSKSKLGSRAHEATCLKQPKYLTAGEVEKPFVCEICGKSFRLKGILQGHKKSHITFPCPICNITINKASETSHMKTQHDKEARICDDCGKLCKNQYAFNSHFARYHRQQPKRMPCDVCGKKCIDKHALSIHRMTHEVGEKNHSCETCGLTFFTSMSLTEHIRRVHTKTKAQTCTVCGLILSSASTLKVHERQHTGVKPYACDVCGKTFAQKPPLNRHLRSQHKIMPALTEKCPHCDKMFPSKMVLKSHMVKAH